MAATRAIPTNLKESDSPDASPLERLQYRSVQSGQSPRAASLRDSVLTGSTTVRPPVALFPPHADGLFGIKDGQDSAERRSESETDWMRTIAELERRRAEEKREAAQAIAAAEESGRREGRLAMEQQVAVERQRLQMQVTETLERFRIERQNYFHDVEGEVVRLALAIAARVLHREAQLDPLLLGGAVRVALEKLGDSTTVLARVPPADVARWKEFFRSTANWRSQPGVLEDPSLSAGECVLATELGTIELGVRAQLQEIEKGFFDLLDRRPTDGGVNAPPANRNSA